MNNFKYYNDSLAYDFELFMPREKNVNNDNVIKMPQKKTVSKQRKAKAQKTREQKAKSSNKTKSNKDSKNK